MTSDPTKPPRPDDERERTARFDPDAESNGDEEAPASGRESTARFTPEEEPPQIQESTSILSADELAEAGANDRDSTARIEIPEDGLAPESGHGGEINDRDSTARLQPQDLPDEADDRSREATRREMTPLPRLPDDSFSAPHTPAPGTRLEDTSPEKLAPTRPVGPGATTRKDVAAQQDTVRESPPGEQPTRADVPFAPQIPLDQQDTPIEPIAVDAALAPTAAGPGLAAAVAPAAAPPEETIEEDLEKPYSLQPEEMTGTGTQGSASARGPRRIPMPLWFIFFMLVGAALFTAIYFLPRSITFPLPKPRTEAAAPIAIPNVADEPPKAWALQDGVFYGKDVLSRPWTYDPVSGKVLHASDNTSALFAPGAFTVVAHPPLEAGTRLAWIAGSAAAGWQLLCRDYNFTADPVPPSPQNALSTSVPLPQGTYPYAPLAIDSADHAIGTLLVVVNGEGSAQAYRPESPTPGEPFWNVTLAGKPLATPLSLYNGNAAKPVYYLLVATAKGMQSIDSLSGQVVGSLDWGKPISGEEIVLGAQRLPGNRQYWGLLAWDGATAFLVDTKPDGQLALVETIECGGAAKKPARMIGFPDGGDPTRDGALLAAADGSLTILTKAGKHELPGTGAAGAITSIDLNGDGLWELINIKSDGGFWVVEGSSLQPGAELDFKRIEMENYAARPATRVYWHIEGSGLIADYFDAEGLPQRLIVELPAVDGVQQTAIINDFNRRRVLR